MATGLDLGQPSVAEPGWVSGAGVSVGETEGGPSSRRGFGG